MTAPDPKTVRNVCRCGCHPGGNCSACAPWHAGQQQPAEATGGEQAQDGAAGRVEALLRREPGILTHDEEADLRAVLAERSRYRIAWRHARTRARSAAFGADLYAKRARELQAAVHDLIDTQIALVLQLKEQSPSGEPEPNAVLAERDALAARVAELEGEREADTRAVDRCQRAKAGPDAVPAMLALDARFADRIAAQAARDEQDGGQRPVHDETTARFLYLAKRTHLNYVPTDDEQEGQR